MSQRGYAAIRVASARLLLGGQDNLEVAGGPAIIPVIGEEPNAVPGDDLAAGLEESRDDVFRFVGTSVFASRRALTPACALYQSLGFRIHASLVEYSCLRVNSRSSALRASHESPRARR